MSANFARARFLKFLSVPFIINYKISQQPDELEVQMRGPFPLIPTWQTN